VAQRIPRSSTGIVYRAGASEPRPSPDCGARTTGGEINDEIGNCSEGLGLLANDQKQELVEQWQSDYPVQVLCEVLNYSRSRYYYHPVEQQDETELKRAIEEIAGEFPTYGYRRVTQQLKRRGVLINHKRVIRLMTEMGLVGKASKKRCRTTNSNHPFQRYPNRVEHLTVERPNQVWVGDITYVRLGSEFVYLAVLMDVFSRSIRGWHLGRGLDHSLTLTALKKALDHSQPEIHHSDQGVQYAATGYVD
jgi:putative transposase